MMVKNLNFLKEANCRLIKYKNIVHERTEDAPFIGALICAVDCKFNCIDCFNQHLKEIKTQQDSAENIINNIKENPFNRGIILGGLEWSLQPFDLRELIDEALHNELQVMLYTGMTENEFKIIFTDIYNKPIYIKFEQYKIDLHVNNYYSYGVRLASSNQYITTLKERI